MLKDFISCKPVFVLAGHLGCYAMRLGNCFRTFQRNIPPSSSELWVCELTHNPEVVHFFKILGTNYQPHGATTQKSCFLNKHAVEPQITVFALLRICFFQIILASSFIVLCWYMADILWRNETIKVFIICDRSRISGEKVQNTLLWNNLTTYSIIWQCISQTKNWILWPMELWKLWCIHTQV